MVGVRCGFWEECVRSIRQVGSNPVVIRSRQQDWRRSSNLSRSCVDKQRGDRFPGLESRSRGGGGLYGIEEAVAAVTILGGPR